MKTLRPELIKTEKTATEALLIRLLKYPEERPLVAAILEPDDLAEELKAHGRIFYLIMAAPAGELHPMVIVILNVLLAIGDTEAADLLVDFDDDIPRTCCLTETVRLALYLHDCARYREDIRLEEEARMRWVDPECECVQIPIEDETDLEW